MLRLPCGSAPALTAVPGCVAERLPGKGQAGAAEPQAEESEDEGEGGGHIAEVHLQTIALVSMCHQLPERID